MVRWLLSKVKSDLTNWVTWILLPSVLILHRILTKIFINFWYAYTIYVIFMSHICAYIRMCICQWSLQFFKKINKLLKRLLERPSEFIAFQHMNYISLKNPSWLLAYIVIYSQFLMDVCMIGHRPKESNFSFRRLSFRNIKQSYPSASVWATPPTFHFPKDTSSQFTFQQV